MFAPSVYIERRKRLRSDVGSGLILFLGNEQSCVNYPDNQYPFRQDSSFLYFFGLDCPGLAAVIDVIRWTLLIALTFTRLRASILIAMCRWQT